MRKSKQVWLVAGSGVMASTHVAAEHDVKLCLSPVKH